MYAIAKKRIVGKVFAHRTVDKKNVCLIYFWQKIKIFTHDNNTNERGTGFMYVMHKRDDGSYQLLKDHLTGVAE